MKQDRQNLKKRMAGMAGIVACVAAMPLVSACNQQPGPEQYQAPAQQAPATSAPVQQAPQTQRDPAPATPPAAPPVQPPQAPAE